MICVTNWSYQVNFYVTLLLRLWNLLKKQSCAAAPTPDTNYNTHLIKWCIRIPSWRVQSVSDQTMSYVIKQRIYEFHLFLIIFLSALKYCKFTIETNALSCWYGGSRVLLVIASKCLAPSVFHFWIQNREDAQGWRIKMLAPNNPLILTGTGVE